MELLYGDKMKFLIQPEEQLSLLRRYAGVFVVTLCLLQ